MPEGSLYWYGNQCTWITGGFRNLCGEEITTTNPYVKMTKFNTNNMEFDGSNAGTNISMGNGTINQIDLRNYNKVSWTYKMTSFVGDDLRNMPYLAFFATLEEMKTVPIYQENNQVLECSYRSDNTIHTESNTFSYNDSRYVQFGKGNRGGNGFIYAIWLE